MGRFPGQQIGQRDGQLVQIRDVEIAGSVDPLNLVTIIANRRRKDFHAFSVILLLDAPQVCLCRRSGITVVIGLPVRDENEHLGIRR